MGQMTFDFEVDDNTPEKPQTEVDKIEKEDKNEITEKAIIKVEKIEKSEKEETTEKPIVEVNKVEKKERKKKTNGKTKAHQLAKEWLKKH